MQNFIHGSVENGGKAIIFLRDLKFAEFAEISIDFFKANRKKNCAKSTGV
jgi:hypothetical protein